MRRCARWLSGLWAGGLAGRPENTYVSRLYGFFVKPRGNLVPYTSCDHVGVWSAVIKSESQQRHEPVFECVRLRMRNSSLPNRTAALDAQPTAQPVCWLVLSFVCSSVHSFILSFERSSSNLTCLAGAILSQLTEVQFAHFILPLFFLCLRVRELRARSSLANTQIFTPSNSSFNLSSNYIAFCPRLAREGRETHRTRCSKMKN